MKKVLILSSIFVLLMCPNLFAYPFIEVEGFSNPTVGVVTDLGDGTSRFSRIDYWFVVTNTAPGAEMNFLSLEFENDVFASIGTISGINPADWTTSVDATLISSTYQLANAGATGTTIGLGETLFFSMLNVVVNNEALADASLWQEGDIWSQSWMARDTRWGGDGGSTTTPVPEPATMLLLGSSLIGLAGLGRWKFKK